MDRQRALSHLPEKYAAPLRLLDRGLTRAEIASAVELEPEAMASFLLLARGSSQPSPVHPVDGTELSRRGRRK